MRKLFQTKSIMFKIATPIPVVILLAVVAAAILIPKAINQNMQAAATESATQTVNQFKKIRAYYTKYVISDVKGSGTLKPGIDHKEDPNVVPLPATLVHDVSALLSEENTSLSLYSAFPFPNRQDRQLDPFMQEAWDYLTANPDGEYQRVETIDGAPILRVAKADQMVSEICVACHNTIASSPKTDWKLGDVRGILEVRQNITSAVAAADRLTNEILAGIIIAGGILLTAAVMIARSLSKPLRRLCFDMDLIKSGEFSRDIRAAHRGDEIGEIGKTLVKMKEDLSQARETEKQRGVEQEQTQAVVDDLRDGLANLTKNDFSQPILKAFPPKHEQLRLDFNDALSKLSATMTQISAAARSVQNGAREISQASGDLSSRTESQAATLEQNSAALDELTQSITSAAVGAKSVETAMSDARAEAENSREVVDSAVNTMNDIAESSQQISQIISVIDDIAFQTNLLALNAGVEAARAGEAGRGFAVVASEVRALAQRSSDAAMEIKTLINNSSGQVEHGVDLVGKAGDALQNITARVNKISELVTEIATGADEQSQSVGEINTGAQQLDQVTQQNAAMVEQVTAAGHILDADATTLSGLVQGFKIDTTTGERGQHGRVDDNGWAEPSPPTYSAAAS